MKKKSERIGIPGIWPLPVIFLLCTSLCFAQTLAPGAPGNDAQWATAGKQGVGTSANLESRIWFTLAQGVMTEVYYPDVTVANVHLLQFVVVNPKTKKVETEQDDSIHQVKVLQSDSLTFQQINTSKSGTWKITKTYTTDPERDSVLIDVKFEPKNRNLSLYVYFDPSIDNSGMHDTGYNNTQEYGFAVKDQKNAAALVFSQKLEEATNGFYGKSDGFESLNPFGHIQDSYQKSEDGNVVQMAKIPKPDRFTVVLGFAGDMVSAFSTGWQSQKKGFQKCLAEYQKGWSDYVKTLRKVDPKYQAQFNMAAMILKAHEDKTKRGANIASLTVPWGGGDNANENNIGGYHLIWSRDLYQVATAYMALGDKDAAIRALDFLLDVQQKADGSFPQNSFLDGKPFWGSLQLDEVAFPLILAYQLGRNDKATYENHIKKAADFIVLNGPKTPQERWEEEGGYSPSTIAAEIAGLICAADIARKNGDEASALIYQAAADDWARKIEMWTATTNGKYGDGNYYLRITQNGNPDKGEKIELNNGAGFFDEREIVDAGFLELVRLGIKSPDDPLIAKSVKVVDEIIRVKTPNGDAFYRYNHDGYGEMDDGRRWNFDGKYTGKGRLWALLSGERGQYELARCAAEEGRNPRVSQGAEPLQGRNPRVSQGAEPLQGRNPRVSQGAGPSQGRNPRVSKGAEPSQGRNPRVSKSAEPSQGRNPRVSKGAEPSQGRNPRVSKGAEPSQGRNPRVSKGAEPLQGRNPRVSKGAEPSQGRNPRVSKGAEPSQGRNPRVSKGAEPCKENPEIRLEAMQKFSNQGMMIPEQIWDKAEMPKNIDKQFIPELKFGEGTGSATPLAWSMAQFIRLAVNLKEGKNLDTPDIVYERYVNNGIPGQVSNFGGLDEEVILPEMKAGDMFKYPRSAPPGTKIGYQIGGEIRLATANEKGEANLDLKMPAEDTLAVLGIQTPDGSTAFERVKLLVKPKTGEFSPELIDRIKNATAFPMIENGKTFLIYRGEAKQVMVAGDLTNWNPRITMKSIGENLKAVQLDLAPTARTEYKLIVDGKWILDPLNPNQINNGVGGDNSLLEMPEYKPTVWDKSVESPFALKPSELEIESEKYGKRVVKIYVPSAYYKRGIAPKLPVLYLHDGSEYVSRAKAVEVLENLIEAKMVAPFMLVFMDPVDRMKEYWASDEYADYVANAVVPAVEQKYFTVVKTGRENRALLGASLGGITSVWIGLKHPETFARIGGQSSSFWVDNERVVKELEKLDPAVTKYTFYFDDGTLEGAEDTRRVNVLLRGKGYNVTYSEGETGHNWTSWRDRLADAFIALWK